jgi:hypothetical protein
VVELHRRHQQGHVPQKLAARARRKQQHHQMRAIAPTAPPPLVYVRPPDFLVLLQHRQRSLYLAIGH